MQKIILKYYNPLLKIAMGNWNQVYFLPSVDAAAIELSPEYYKGRLVFRLPASTLNFSYKCIMQDVESKETIMLKNEFELPF